MHTASARQHLVQQKIAKWLLISVGLILLIILVGAVTRLTHSGLSMVDWRPIMGVLPPFSEQSWQETFAAYKLFPEFQKVNQSMDLTAFKKIFFWEYLHRILGRVLGLLCLALFFWSLRKKECPFWLKSRLLMLAMLVGLQGLLGWYMVKSGLVDRPAVSHYRLAAHLLLAFFTMQFALWSIFELKWGASSFKRAFSEQKALSLSLLCFILLLITQIIYGAFTAALRIGFAFNTFPKMLGQWIPSALGSVLDNPVSIQFVHRSLAYALILCLVLVFYTARKYTLKVKTKKGLKAILHALSLQFVLGVLTLLYVVPISLAVLHQFGAVLLLSSSVFVFYSLGTRTEITGLRKERV